MPLSHSKRILVTGGAGFIGSHLCERLVSEGLQVTCVDDYSSGRRENVAHLLREPNFTVIEHDIVYPISIEVDEIFNLACPASPVHYRRDPVQTMRTCVNGSINMLDLATRTKARILQASTSEVYGDPEVHPQREDYLGRVNPIGARGCYDEGKRAAETLFFDYHRRHGTRIKVARIFNTYGPRMRADDGRVITNFIIQAFDGRPLTIYGDGGQTRSFCYIGDMVDGLLSLMRTSDEIVGPMNLGSPDEIGIEELARLVAREVGSTSAFEHCPASEDEPRRRKPDISMARQTIGWEPRVSLADGIRIVADHFRARSGETSRMRAEINISVGRPLHP